MFEAKTPLTNLRAATAARAATNSARIVTLICILRDAPHPIASHSWTSTATPHVGALGPADYKELHSLGPLMTNFTAHDMIHEFRDNARHVKLSRDLGIHLPKYSVGSPAHACLPRSNGGRNFKPIDGLSHRRQDAQALRSCFREPTPTRESTGAFESLSKSHLHACRSCARV